MLTPINWNTIHDPVDKAVWDRLTANFWLDTKVPVSNDLDSWRKMTPDEQEVVKRVFASLTLLDTVQSSIGAPKLQTFAATQHEEAVFANIGFMEAVHAKSYSTIFSTLCSTEEIYKLFRWAEEDDLLQAQANGIVAQYTDGSHGAVFAASVILESFLFYTGFYAPLRLAAEGKLTNTADIIRLILRDEGVHGYYIGHKFQTRPNPEHLDVRGLLSEFYERELERAEQLYDRVGWTEDVKHFLRYNANKALLNLGYEPMFDEEETRIPSYILAALDPGTGEAHDFFSGSGASYVIGTTEETTQEDWDWD